MLGGPEGEHEEAAPLQSRFMRVLSDGSGQIRSRVIRIYLLLIVVNVVAWAWALVAFRNYPVLLGTAFLAYSFGLRHAVDADHIAAIDNVTRKLMQEGKRPVTVGFFFSLGHSTIVFLLSAAVAAMAAAFKDRIGALQNFGGIVGTLVSASFLLAIAMVNIVIFVGVYKTFQHVKNGGAYVDEDFNTLLAGRGFIARLTRPLFRLIEKSWHMYFLGFLFGLGFDTATEVGLLGISAAEAGKGMPIWSILVFPVLFTAGMSLIDTTDGVLMLGAYGWAFLKPIRKLYYNLTITFVSVLIALIVGLIEVLGLIQDQLSLTGAFWRVIGSLNDNFGVLGYVIIGIFILSWVVSVVVYRVKRYGEFDEAGQDADPNALA